jgi:hypothetical protein
VYSQIYDLIQRIRVLHWDHVVDRSIGIVFELYHLISRSCTVCARERKTNEILEHYFLGWTVIHGVLLFADGLGTLKP